MKKLYLLFTLLVALAGNLMAQNQTTIQRLDSLIGEFRYATAYPVARDYYHQTLASGSGTEQLIAAFYLNAIDYAYSKDPADSAILRFSPLTRSLHGSDRAVAYALLFQSYSYIYNHNQYKINRNKPHDDPNTNCRLWHRDRFVDTLMMCADSILVHADQLRKVSPLPYAKLISSDSSRQALDTTLFGVLVQSLLDASEHYLSNKDKAKVPEFQTLHHFVARYAAADTLLPYPLLLHHHVAQQYLESPADQAFWLDQQRAGLYHNFNFSDDTLYNNYHSKLQNPAMKALLGYHRAAALDEQDSLLAAERLCLETERNYPESYAAASCRVLRGYINRPQFKVEYTHTYSSKGPRLACVHAANISLLHFRLVPEIDIPYNMNKDERIDTLLSLTPVKEWQQPLPDSGDHRMHDYLVPLPAVPQGYYYLMAYTDSTYAYSDYGSADALFINYSSPILNKHLVSGHLVDRVTGQPLAHHRVTLESDGTLGKTHRRHDRTDRNGYFQFSRPAFYRMLTDNMYLSTMVEGYQYEHPYGYYEMGVYDKIDKTITRLELVMTDRPIYRLGDTVSFCCMAYKSQIVNNFFKEEIKPTAGLELTAVLARYGGYHDTLYLTTDSHGRCWGSFVLPKDIENGTYHIEIEDDEEDYRSNETIRVEAYKPPHFFVSLSSRKDSRDSVSTYRFGLPVTVYGTVSSYSGAPMGGAKVSWEVSCEKYSDPLQWQSSPEDWPFSDSLTVGPDGLFQFSFTPQLDSAIGISSNTAKTTYIYTAKVIVTDADGELHDAELSFHVSEADGYCLLLSDDLRQLRFAYNTFDHHPLSGEVRVELYQLRQPDTLRLLDPLMRESPEARWVGTHKQFRQLFPHSAFTAQECDPHHWPVVAKRLDQTTRERTLTVDNLPSGVYRITFSTPDGNTHDTIVNYVAPNGRVTGNQLVFVRTNPKSNESYYPSITCRIGDTIRLELGSPYGNQPLYYRVGMGAAILQSGMLTLDSSRLSHLTIPITEDFTDHCRILLTAVRQGQIFNQAYDVNIVRPERWLNLQALTLRDRMQPGDRETVTLRIANSDSLGIPANLCLTLFDSSLYQYEYLHFGFNPYQNYAYYIDHRVNAWDSPRVSFDAQSSLTSYYGYSYETQLGFSLFKLSDFHKTLARWGKGVLVGTVTDAKTEEPIPFVNVVLRIGGAQLKGAQTDFDGVFALKDLPLGNIQLEFSSVGYQRLIMNINYSDYMKTLEVKLNPSSVALEEVQIVDCKVPVIEIGAPESGYRLSADDIARMPGTSVDEIVASVGGVGYSDGRERAGIQVPKEAIAEITPAYAFGQTAGQAPDNLRQNLSTRAFFEPALRSDDQGLVSVTFTLPDALTRWQMIGFAWTDQMQLGTFRHTILSQKELMVQPLLPRFLRQGDTVRVPAKVSNLTDSTQVLRVSFEFANAAEGQPDTPHRFDTLCTLTPHSSATVSTTLAVSDRWHVAKYKIYAVNADGAAAHLSDGEQGQLAVLSNRQRVTASRLLYLPPSTDSLPVSRHYSFPIRLNGTDSLTLSYNANPADYAIQALPHFKRHFMPGNIYLANSIYTQAIALQVDSLGPHQRKVAERRLERDFNKLLNRQKGNGGWSWMPDGKTPSRYVTEAIMQRLAACAPLTSGKTLLSVRYLNSQLTDAYKQDIQQDGKAYRSDLFSLLYTRSLYLAQFPFQDKDSVAQKAFQYYYQQCRQHMYDDLPLHTRGQMALLMLHVGDTAEAVHMADLIREAAHTDELKGMYWIGNVSGYGWYQRPIETAALLVDVFADVLHDWQSVGRIQQWILASKQGTTWRTDMATAAAVAALLRQPQGNAKPAKAVATITVNDQPIALSDTAATQLEVAPNTTALDVQLSSNSRLPSWGALFHSRELPLDSIPADGSALALRKTFSRVNADGSLTLLRPGEKPKVGERFRVHIDIDCQRDMDNMVLNDSRAAGFEPAITKSGWRWNDGLSYYVDVRDEGLNCYIDRLGEGHYYVEYDLYVRHAGTFSVGPCILHSVYAPEFRANTSSSTLRME